MESIRNTKLRLARGLSHWLTFEFSCNRGYLFSEYYLAQAVGQLLSPIGPKVIAEVPHPTLHVMGSRGRPPSIDFVVYSNQNKDAPPHLAVETKWAGTSDVTPGALVWDALRLAAHHKESDAPGLLLLGGTKRRLKALCTSKAFQRTNTDANGQSIPILPLRTGAFRLTLTCEELSTQAATYVTDKMEKSPAGAIPKKIRIEKPQYMEGNGHDTVSFGVYVWEVQAADP